MIRRFIKTVEGNRTDLVIPQGEKDNRIYLEVTVETIREFGRYPLRKINSYYAGDVQFNDLLTKWMYTK